MVGVMVVKVLIENHISMVSFTYNTGRGIRGLRFRIGEKFAGEMKENGW
jgi:hypothetical protein